MPKLRDKNHCIERTESIHRGHGRYTVRIRKWNGKNKKRTNLAFESFMDKDYGGKRNALAAAQTWRDEKLMQHFGSLLVNQGREGLATKKAKNTTGIVGVLHVEPYSNNGERGAYCALWTQLDDSARPPRRRRYRKFFSYPVGDSAAEKKAFAAAKKLRKSMEKEHYTGRC